MSDRTAVQHAPTGPLTLVGLGAAGVLVAWWAFVTTFPGQRADAAALSGAAYGRNELWRLAEPVLEVVSVGFLAAVLLAAVLVAAARRRWLLAVQVGVLMGGANLTTQLLKHTVLDRPSFGLGIGSSANTLPSGHTTAAASAAAALVLVVPPRARPAAAWVGAAYTAATGVSTLVGQWHRPSDAIAAVLVVLAWVGVAALLPVVRPVPGERSTGRVGAGMLLGTGAVAAVPAAAALAVTLQSADPFATRAGLLIAYGGGAGAVVAATCCAAALPLLMGVGSARRAAAGRGRRPGGRTATV